MKLFTSDGVYLFIEDRSSRMATWTKQLASHRGESRRCRWHSSRALAPRGSMPRFATKSQVNAIALPETDYGFIATVVRAAGPPG